MTAEPNSNPITTRAPGPTAAPTTIPRRATPRKRTLAGLIAAAAATAAIATRTPSDAPPAQADRPFADAWPGERIEERLRALNPDDALAHFRLAEDIAAIAETDNELRLVQQLFAVAGIIDRAQPEPVGLTRSVALALADLAPAPERLWLLAMARSLDDTSQPDHASTPSNANTPSDEPAARLAQALARARAGEGLRMRAALRPVETEDELRRAGLPETEIRETLSILEQVQQTPRCPVCNNARIVHRDDLSPVPSRNAGDDRPTHNLCERCGGHPGPPLDADATAALVRAEARLLSAEARSWGGQIAIDNAQPVRTLDPDALAPAFGLTPNARTYTFPPGSPFRGSWSR
mgnify:CR=1 FL=1